MEKAPKPSNVENSQALVSEPRLDMTPEEAETHIFFEIENRLRNLVREHYINPGTHAVGEKLDSLRNTKDTAIKKALMLDYREGVKQDKVAQLEAQLEGMNPNTMRYRRLSKKLGKTAIKLGDLRTAIGIRSGAIENRAMHRDRIKEGRERHAYIKRELLLVAKKVGYEKKVRREMKEKVNTEQHPGHKEQLRAEYNSRVSQSIGKFREGLVREVLQNADRRQRLRQQANISTPTTDTMSAEEQDSMLQIEQEYSQNINSIQSDANQKFIEKMGEAGGILEQYEDFLELETYLEKQIANATTDEEKGRWERIIAENDEKMNTLKQIMDQEYLPIEDEMIENEAYAQNEAIDKIDHA